MEIGTVFWLAWGPSRYTVEEAKPDRVKASLPSSPRAEGPLDGCTLVPHIRTQRAGQLQHAQDELTASSKGHRPAGTLESAGLAVSLTLSSTACCSTPLPVLYPAEAFDGRAPVGAPGLPRPWPGVRREGGKAHDRTLRIRVFSLPSSLSGSPLLCVHTAVMLAHDCAVHFHRKFEPQTTDQPSAGPRTPSMRMGLNVELLASP